MAPNANSWMRACHLLDITIHQSKIHIFIPHTSPASKIFRRQQVSKEAHLITNHFNWIYTVTQYKKDHYIGTVHSQSSDRYFTQPITYSLKQKQLDQN